MPPYRLQTLLEMRERAKEEAEQAFSAAIKELEKEKVELKRLEDDLEKRKAERQQREELTQEEIGSALFQARQRK